VARVIPRLAVALAVVIAVVLVLVLYWAHHHDSSATRPSPGSDEVDVEFGHNGCNTRDDILRRDLAELVVRRGTCYADRGTLNDPYTGERIAFVRGPDTSNSVEIDHLVSLADAWYKGARTWADQRRLDFANDPRNLLAVSPKANFNKAFRDAASWLPPNEAFRCEFVRRQIDVKTAYGLWLAEKEKRALSDVLKRC
jgi:Protein of unknown function (DUF1524)